MDNVPKHTAVNCEFTHSTCILELDLRLPLKIILEIDSVTSYIDTCYPDESKLKNCTHVNLTSSEVWDSHSKTFHSKMLLL